MRFLHIADMHIGMQPDKGTAWSEQRRDEIADGFRRIIDICNKEGIDLLLIAGDAFHRQPLVRELKEMNSLFGCLHKTKVVLISGNHDYMSGTSPYNGFEWNGNVTMLKSHEISSVYFEELNAEVYGLSYHTREIREPLYKGIKPSDGRRINILLAHGGTLNSIPADYREMEKSGFDYVAFGHIHKHQIISDRIMYAGSPEPLDKNETGEHGYIIGELVKQNDCPAEITTEFRVHAGRRYIKAEVGSTGEMTNTSLRDNIEKLIAENGRENIYIITIRGYRDADIIYDTERMKELGNILELTDESVPDYDFEVLERENRDNLIGMYIERIKEKETDKELSAKALYYGLEALLTK